MTTANIRKAKSLQQHPLHSTAQLDELGAALVARLPGSWTSEGLDLTARSIRDDIDDRLWDLGMAQWALQVFVYRAGVHLRGPGRQELLVVIAPRTAGRIIIAAPLMPADFGSVHEYDEDLPLFAISASSTPPRAAAAIERRLLPRYQDALHRIEREAAAFTPTSQDLTGERREPPLVAPAMVTLPESAFRALLAPAVEALLPALAVRLDDHLALSQALARGGHVACDALGLPDELAPWIEAATAHAVLTAGGTPPAGLTDRGLPDLLAAFDAKRTTEQREAVERALEGPASTPGPRELAATGISPGITTPAPARQNGIAEQLLPATAAAAPQSTPRTR